MLKENEKYIVTGVDYTSEGIGLAKVDNFPLFINNLIIGEEAEIQITKVLRSLALPRLFVLRKFRLTELVPLIPKPFI